MKRLAGLLCAATFVVAGSAWAAKTAGSCQSAATAISLGATVQVSLVDEWSPEYDDDGKETSKGENTGYGAYWYKLTLSRYSSCSVWIEGASSSDVWLSVESDPDNWELSASFVGDSLPNGVQYAVLASSDWSEYDPGSGTFYIGLSGDIGDSATLHVEAGVKEFKLDGTWDNPVSIVPTEKWKTSSGSLWEGSYYFSASLSAGKIYQFCTEGGTRSFPCSLSIYSEKAEFDMEPDTDPEVAKDYNEAYIVSPQSSGTFIIEFYGYDTYKLKYRILPGLTPEQHHPEDLPATEEEGVYAAEFTPGRLRSGVNRDNVIDEYLFRIHLEEGQRCLFETSGAETNILMMAYDADGNVLASSYGMPGSLDAICGIEATATTNYYVGVCNPALDVADAPGEGGKITLTATLVSPVDGSPDEWDVADDTFEGATEFLPQIGPSGSAAADVDPEGLGVHGLDRADWYDVYSFAATAGVGYSFEATWAEESTESDLVLCAEVFGVGADGKPTLVKSGDLMGPDRPLDFFAEHSRCYVRVFVKDGIGLEPPQYVLHAAALGDYGLMHVAAKGAPEATFTYKGLTYPCDTTIVIEGSNTVSFSSISGLATPAAQVVAPVADELVEVLGVYKDTYDPADDVAKGATKIAPANKDVVTSAHTLYAEDAVDYFKFEAKAGYFYTFALTNETGDAVFEILDSEGGPVTEGPVTAFVKKPLANGSYYLRVQHADAEDPQDAAYAIVHRSTQVGDIKFAKVAVSAKENAAYVDLAVKRTAKEGRVRVAYSTVEGTALPQVDYYPASGVLEWADGDSKDKTIRVRLIPDEVPTWEPDKEFTVELKPVEDELEYDEYLASVTTPSATVKLTEVSKKAAGTVSVTEGVVEDESISFSAKKPAFTVTAGDCLALTLSRKDGGNDKVAVRVQSVNGTAVAGSDFEALDTIVEWEDGDVEDKVVELFTLEQYDQYKESKALSLKLSSYVPSGAKDYGKVKVGTSSVSVTVKNNLVASTAETYAKSLDKSGGISLKAGKAGQWYIEEASGNLMSVPADKAGSKAELSFTLTGPGLFVASPYMDGDGTFMCKAGKEADVDCSSGEEYVRLVGSGSTTLKFTLVASKAGAVAGFDSSYGAPYVWIPFGSVTPSAPVDKARVLPDEDGVALAWNVPVETYEYGVRYRVSFADNKSLKDAQTVETDEPMSVSPALTAGKTWYWRVDYGCEFEGGETEWVNGKSVWSFSTTGEGAAMALVADGQVDALGNVVADGVPATLMQGVKASVEFASDDGEAGFSVLSGKLPDGVKLAQDKLSKKWVASGVPTKAGSYSAVVQAKSGKVAGTTVVLDFDVLPTTLAAGTFTGVFNPDEEESSAATNGCARMASVTFTSTAAGKLSAKVAIAGKTYTFAATGFDKVSDYDPYLGRSVYYATLTQVQKVGKAAYTNILEAVVENADEDDLEVAGREPAVKTTLLMAALPDAKGSGAQYNLKYTGALRRNNAKIEAVLAGLQEFVGYYTMALCPPAGASAVEDGVPSGYGYLTVTVDAKGAAKVAGSLADGTSVSLSAVPFLLGDLGDDIDSRATVLVVPVYFAKGQTVFGGEVLIAWEDEDADAPVVDSSSLLAWYNDDPSSTYGGKEGFGLEVVPAGGWYNTLFNLQAHYLTSQFELSVSDELPPELLAAGYQFAVGGVPTALPVTLTGDALSVDKRSLVKETESKTRYDLFESVNPWNVSVSFKRATGVLTGSFSIWADNGEKQSEIKNLKHAGVLLLSRGGETSALLPDTAWTAGYYLAPTTIKEGSKSRKWNASLPFCITEHPGMEVFDGIDNWGE